MLIVDGVEREKTPHHKPRGLRWSSVKATDKKALSSAIDVKKSYNFLPYSYIITPLLFYSGSSKEVLVVPRGDIPSAIWFLLAIVAPTLLPSKLDTKAHLVCRCKTVFLALKLITVVCHSLA